MKLTIFFTGILLFVATCSFGQFSIGGGITNPIGSFTNLENAAAIKGYQIAASYDISNEKRYGISTGLLIGQNSLNENSVKFKEGQWSFVLMEAGGFVQLMNNLKLKTLISTGVYATPELNIENGTITANRISVGCVLKIEYSFNKFYIGSNFLYAKPKFIIPNGAPIRYSFSTLGLIIGYTF